MGKILSVASKKINRFNVENRAHRLLDKQQSKPYPAPKFDSNVKDYQRVLLEHPEEIAALNKKDSALDNRLKQVYVTSTDPIIGNGKNTTHQSAPNYDFNKPLNLPIDRKPTEDFEYGYKEPINIPLGKCTLRQAMEFITSHQTDPVRWNKKMISEKYKLDENRVENILLYYRSFQLFIPEKSEGEMSQIKHFQFMKYEPTEIPEGNTNSSTSTDNDNSNQNVIDSPKMNDTDKVKQINDDQKK